MKFSFFPFIRFRFLFTLSILTMFGTYLFPHMSMIGVVVMADDDGSNSILSHLRQKYDELPEKGKFAAGALVGFSGSRIAIKSAVTVVKVAGAAFVATEVLNAAGMLDDIPNLSAEHTEMAQDLKQRAIRTASSFRQSVRRRLNPEQLKNLMETDKMATLGTATGAFVGFLL